MSPSIATSVRARRKRVRRRDAAETRRALLEAGTELFAQRGYDGVPLWAIADRAGVNKAMVSYHFGGKRDLYLAILSATFSEIVAQVEALADSPRPPPDLLLDLVAVIGDVATRRHPYFCTMMLREALAGGKHLERAVLDQPARILGAVRRIIERGVRDGALRPVDPLLTHLSLVGSLVFFFATARFRERVIAKGLVKARPPEAGAHGKPNPDLVPRGLAADPATRRPLNGTL